MGRFKNGSIVRIELDNFMIFQHAEFYPGSYLNLILGPNGSGKSALVCSIIMGFGGDPSITGRSTNLIDYVRFGAKEASILIEIYSDNSKNHIIQREFKVTSKSNKNECHCEWKLNGQAANKTKIKEFTQQLNIDINNLCQILPQERVVEFSRLSPKNLLLSTEKSIGDVHMYENHMKLIKLSEELSEFDQKIKENRAYTLKFQSFKTNIEPDLKLIQQKKTFEEQIDWLKKKKVWLEFEEKRLEYIEIKERLSEKTKEYNNYQKTIQPIKENISNVETLMSSIKGNKFETKKLLSNYLQKLSDVFSAIESGDNNITHLLTSFSEKLSEQKRSVSRLAQYELDWNYYKNDLKNYSSKDELETQSDRLKSEIASIKTEIGELMTKIGSIKIQLNNCMDEKRFNEKRKQYINDLFNTRMEKISSVNSNAKTAYEWLQKNANLFSGKIYPPLITQINVIRNEWVNYVETVIGSKDMSTFLFEKIEDLELFSDQLKNQLDIRVNIAMIPTDVDHNDTFDIKEYASYGIFARVSDLFTAPEQVMSYLIKTYNINHIPVGNSKTEERIYELINASPFKKILTNKNQYVIVISVYDNEKSTRISSLNPAKYLNIIIDEKEIHDIDETLKNIDATINSLNKTLEKQNSEIDILKHNNEEKQNEYNEIFAKISEILKIEAKIVQKEQQIKSIKESMDNVGKWREEMVAKVNKMYSNQYKLLKSTFKILIEYFAKIKLMVPNEIKIRIVNYLKSSYERQHLSLVSEETTKQNELRELNQSFLHAKTVARDLREKAKEKSGFNFDEHTDPKIKAAFDELPDRLEDVNIAISRLKMSCEGIKNVDEDLLNQYRKYQHDIEEKEAQCVELEEHHKNKKNQIDSLRPIWIENLNKVINKINENFSNFMGYLNFCGEVYLYEGNNEYAFSEYGIRIKVKFRDSEPMKDLDAYHQSGGERSVSTMIYMLALQELAFVPFRVVDEINQGMDEKNERFVFDLIAQVSKKNSSQYFLMSPKLLTKLNYTRELKIHIIFNAPYVFVDWNKILAALLKDKEEEMENNEDED